MNRTTTTSAEQAQFSTEMGSALVHLDRALDHLSGIRSEVGARLSVLDQTDDTRGDTEVDLQELDLAICAISTTPRPSRS